MRLAMGGCVARASANRPSCAVSPRPSGSAMQRCAAPRLMCVVGASALSIFCSALASALQKIESADAPTTHIKRGAAHLCIADPLGRGLTAHEGLFADALATHPPMAKRITILRGMGYAQLKKEGGTVA